MGTKWPFQQVCWDTGQIALCGRCPPATGSVHPPGTNWLSAPRHHSCRQRAGPPPKFPVVPKPGAEKPRGGGGRELAALNPKTLCCSRKAPPRQQQVSRTLQRGQEPLQGTEGLPTSSPQPSPQLGKSKRRGTHRSSCDGWMYPEERMFRDRMLGSMRDSSASGVFRIRPASTAWGHCSGDRWWPCEGPREGQGQPACLHPPEDQLPHHR